MCQTALRQKFSVAIVKRAKRYTQYDMCDQLEEEASYTLTKQDHSRIREVFAPVRQVVRKLARPKDIVTLHLERQSLKRVVHFYPVEVKMEDKIPCFEKVFNE